MACLRLTDGPDKGRVFQLPPKDAYIGRSLDNTIALSDPSASRIHALVAFTPSGFILTDQNSSHGVFVNGSRISSAYCLKPKDSILIGSTEMVFEEDTPPPSPSDRMAPAEDDFSRTIRLSVDVSEATLKQGRLPQDQAAVLSQMADAIRSVFDTDELLGILIRLVGEVFKPDRGVVLLRDPQTGGLTPKIVWPQDVDSRISQTVVKHAVESAKSLLISDMDMDERFSGANSILAQNIRWAICSPLICRDTVYGALYIDAQRPQLAVYSRNDVALLNILASEAAMALENAVLVQEKIQAERMAAIGVAIAGISHYVKNVLFGVSGSSTLIDQALERKDLDVISKMWPVMKRSTAKITVLVQDMLSYSKPREPELKPGNINTLATEVYEGLADRAREASVDLQLSLDYDVTDSHFDPKTIHDSLLNLAGNAVEACAEQEGEKRVVISTGLDPDTSMQFIRIEDNGPGISPENQKRIFEPFFSTKGSKGTGLGLAVARKSVEEHGGKMQLQSAPGEGATFTIYLPVQVSEE